MSDADVSVTIRVATQALLRFYEGIQFAQQAIVRLRYWFLTPIGKAMPKRNTVWWRLAVLTVRAKRAELRAIRAVAAAVRAVLA